VEPTVKIALPISPYNRVDLFEAAGFEVVEGPVASTEDLIDPLKDADGAQVGTIPLTTREVMEACPKLKVVSRMGVVIDSIDLDAATGLGVLACNVPGVNTAEVADHAMAMLLALTRRIPDAVSTTRDGAWSQRRELTGEYQQTVRRIGGHTVGVLGFGNIGRAFAPATEASGRQRSSPMTSMCLSTPPTSMACAWSSSTSSSRARTTSASTPHRRTRRDTSSMRLRCAR